MSAMLRIAGADTAERARRFAFLVTVAAALFAGYLYVPGVHAGYATVTIHGHRGIYNSAFLGAAIAILTSSFLGLVGFFLVRGSVERDRELNVDGIVGASPVRRAVFLLGKFASNLVVLCAIAAISFVAAGFMQEIRGEDRHIDVLAFVGPFALISIPAMAMVAAIAVAFDVIRPLRGIIGSIVYVAVWMAVLIVPITSTGSRVSPFDPFGTTTVTASLSVASLAAYPKDRNIDVTIGGDPVPKSGLSAYRFDGICWTLATLAGRLVWIPVAILLVLLSSLFFDRFTRDAPFVLKSSRSLDFARLIPNLPALRLLRAEFSLLVNGAGMWWPIGALGLAVATGLAPLEAVTHWILPVALIWPLERLSALGARERRWNVAGMLGATPRFAGRTLVAQWAAGTILGALICAGYLLRLSATGHAGAVLACLAVVAATAAVALALGTMCGSSRPFEAAYLLLWYVGPINHVPQLDFAAATLSAPLVLLLVCVALTVPCLVLASAGRHIAVRA